LWKPMTSYNFEALTDFHNSLNEVDTLVKVSNGYQTIGKNNKRLLVMRSAVLFLGTHLECFFEALAEEYLFKIEQLALPRERIPEKLLMSSVHYHFTEQLITKVQSKNPTCKEQLIKLANIVACEEPVTELKIDTSFSYGKHGSGVVEKLFKRLDIENIFENSPVYIEEESMLSDEPIQVEVNIKNKFNVLTGIRNGLIHEYNTPQTEVIEAILSDIQLYKKFGGSLVSHLTSKLEKLTAEPEPE